jgi:outer membrane protein assembly factor BamB
LSWHQTFSPAGDAGAASVLAPVAALGGLIIVPITATQDAGIVCLDVPADSRRTSAVRWRHRTANGVSLSPAVAGGAVLVVDGGVGDAGRSLHALDAAGGTLRWKFAVDRNASGAFLATAEEILIASEPGALRALDLAGAPRWSAPTGELEREAAAADAMVIAAARRPAALIALDRLTGRELWRAALDAEPRGPPIPGRDTVYIGTAAGLEARSLLDGGLLAGWTRAGGAVASDIALGREQLAFVNASAELVVVSRAGGGVLHRLAGALPGVAPLLGRDLFLYATPDALMKLVLTEEDAEPEAWMPLEAAGAPSGPMVLSDSALYFGAAGRGLARVGARP